VGARVLWLLGCSAAACSIEHGVVHNPPVDAPPDVPTGPLTSCAAIHAADPAAPSGGYTIDPDGPAGEAPVAVTCDMTFADGGWTIVFFAPSANMMTPPIAYTSGTKRLLADAGSTLIAYRNSTQQVIGSAFATFNLPIDWKLDTPFNYPATDVMVNVSAGGGAPVMAMLRYGSQNFGSRCVDGWNSASSLGRVCIAGTNAPFFNAFIDAIPDNCSNSSADWNAAGCTPELRFSIAVR
jgi:hypothetical protein